MLGLIALTVSVLLAIFGHRASRDFTRRRLRYTRVAERPGVAGILAGIGVGVLSMPILAFVPLLGAGSAMLLGAGVGTGVAIGAGEPRR